MHLIRQTVLELPTIKGGINLVNITTKVKAFTIKHMLDLIFDITTKVKAFRIKHMLDLIFD